ncbi:EamA family transporter [Aureimonas leprariae]|uniref:EamA family transporter n=1 Tax=Plantimonas leprariae TaxID=2615207 RepID=A0A7V7TWN7_9HYPH|nr:EamA family transporter [Aureimonas leprariae]KAB0679810.1 EamA family transporter [Aureimonas leprariae]
MNSTLPLRHILLAVAVVAVWGTNFVVIRVALDHLPPFLFGALRFTLACLPGIFLVRKPEVRWRSLAAYGLLIGSGQFGLLYYAMRADISPGLASLVLQTQVFFTIGLALLIAKERVRSYQVAGLVLAALGIATIALHTGGSTTPFGLFLALTAALSWACGNIVAKQSGVRSMLPFVIWASLFSAPPLFALSFAFEGWDAIRAGIANADVGTWATVVWQTVGNTLFGYAAWGFLLSRYPAASVTPMALLVPIFGMAASTFWLGEPLPAWKLAAAALVIGGLALGMLAGRWQDRRLLARAAQAAPPPGSSA